MSIVVLKLPEVKVEAGRPHRCSVCKGETFQRWGGRWKRVRDHAVKQVWVNRYRCCQCKHTFRQYPEGVDQAQQSQRLRRLAALSWVLGLSFRGIAGLFAVFGVGISRMSAWRDEQEWAKQLQRRGKTKSVRVLGLDGAYVRGWGEVRPVLVAVDLGGEQPVALGYVDEKDPQAVRRWLAPLVQQLGVSVSVTDDLVSYRTVAEKLNLEHQVCQFHVRRWVGKPCMNCGNPCHRIGSGCWMKSSYFWAIYPLQAADGCSSFTGKSRNASLPKPMRLSLPWKNCAYCSFD